MQPPTHTEPSGYDCGVLNGGVAYLAHPVFSLYAGFGAVAHRDYVLAVIESLMGGTRTVRTTLPSQGRVTVTRQPGRRIVLPPLTPTSTSAGGKISVGDAPWQGAILEVVARPRGDAWCPRDGWRIGPGYSRDAGTAGAGASFCPQGGRGGIHG